MQRSRQLCWPACTFSSSCGEMSESFSPITSTVTSGTSSPLTTAQITSPYHITCMPLGGVLPLGPAPFTRAISPLHCSLLVSSASRTGWMNFDLTLSTSSHTPVWGITSWSCDWSDHVTYSVIHGLISDQEVPQEVQGSHYPVQIAHTHAQSQSPVHTAHTTHHNHYLSVSLRSSWSAENVMALSKSGTSSGPRNGLETPCCTDMELHMGQYGTK